MKKAYKIEINPTETQKQKINQTIGTCRFIYNFFIAYNKEIYEKEKRFVSGFDFSKWLNNDFIPNNQEYAWIKETSSKATKQAIMNAETAYKKFFKETAKFPKFKKKSNQDVKAYFPKDGKTSLTIERHRVKLPTLGFVRLKEYGYIPNNAKVSSATVSKKADRYYISILVDEEIRLNNKEFTRGIGIDLGIKDFAIMSDGTVKKNINKTNRVKKLEKKLKREQRKFSRKYESLKKKTKIEKEKAARQNIKKQLIKIQKLYQTLTNIRTDYINKTVSEIIKQKPSFITLEDLNISGMMKNRRLSKAILQQKFYEFRTKLTNKAKQNDIEVRIVDRWYPSSKLCSCCGNKKADLKLSDRIYNCTSCGTSIDRDLNAALNLELAIKYKTV